MSTRKHFRELGVGVNIIIKIDLKGSGTEISDRIQLSHDRIHWRALLNTVLKFRLS